MTEKQIGLLSSAGTMIFLGILLPIATYKLIQSEDSLTVLFMRIFWALLLMIFFQILRGRLKNIFLFDYKTLAILALAALLSLSNWLIFIYSIKIERMNDSALGYFIMPILNIGLAFIFFKETLNRLQIIAIIFASIGVGWAIYSYGEIPFIALGVSLSFGFYGVLKKQVKINVYSGMLIELVFMLCLSIIVALWLKNTEMLLIIRPSLSQNIEPLLIGFCSIMPLIFFAVAVKKLDYSLVAVLQWVIPSFQFILSLFVWKENFDTHKLITFIFIWIGLAFYGYSLIEFRAKRSYKKPI